MTGTHEYNYFDSCNMSASEACTSSAVLPCATVLCSWPVEKYARFVPTFPPLPTGECEARKSNTAGSWQTSTFRSGEADIALLQGNHLLLKAGSIVLESFSLWEAKQSLKGVAKGDSMLFMCKIKGESRRFRIKFAATPSQSSPEICKSAVEVLESIFPIKNASDLSLDTQKFGTQTDSNSQTSACGSNLSVTAANSQNPSMPETQSRMPCPMEMLPQHPGSTEAFKVSSIATQPQLQVPLVVGNVSTVMPVQSTLLSRVLDHTYANSGCEDAAVVMDEGEPASLPHSSAMGPGRLGSNEEIQLSEYFSDAKTYSDLVKEMLGSKAPLGRAYADCNIPRGQLAQFIRLCFLDQNFPAFVEAVQTELSKM